MNEENGILIVILPIIIGLLLIINVLLTIVEYFWNKARNQRMKNFAKEFNLSFEDKLTFLGSLKANFLLISVPFNRLQGNINTHTIDISDHGGYFRMTTTKLDRTQGLSINNAFLTILFLTPIKVLEKEFSFLK